MGSDPDIPGEHDSALMQTVTGGFPSEGGFDKEDALVHSESRMQTRARENTGTMVSVAGM
jgi:hypothetical protein